MTPLRVCRINYCLFSILISQTLAILGLKHKIEFKIDIVSFQNLAVKERNESVEAARLSTWWHFVCLLGARGQELFDQVLFVTTCNFQLRQLLPYCIHNSIASVVTIIIIIITDVKNPFIIIIYTNTVF